MAKFVGVKNGKIQVVSDNKFSNSNLEIIELSDDLQKVSANELMLNFKIKNGKMYNKNIHRPIRDLKIAFVSNYAQACGLSTYFENLIKNLIGKIGEFKLFAEYIDKFNIENDFIPDNNKVFCWKRGESLGLLIKELKKYDPDIIIINHEFGLFPNARYWMSMLTELSEYKILTIMHSVFPYHFDKTIVEASMSNIVVHSEQAKQALIKDKGINSNIYVIPHGCYEMGSEDKLWNFYKSEMTFVQMGFGFRYKAFEECIEATALLKEKYPNVFFTALISESPHAKFEHELYYNYLKELIEKLQVNENVAIIRGFQTDKVIDSYLRTNKVAVFPYKISDPNHLVYGASGAARLAMSKNMPVITSTIPHFLDLPTIKADSAKNIAKELDLLFCDKNKISNQVNIQNEFIKNNSWQIISDKYIKVIETIN